MCLGCKGWERAGAGTQHHAELGGLWSLINPLSVFACLDPHTVQAYNALIVQETKLLCLNVAAMVLWSCLNWRFLK